MEILNYSNNVSERRDSHNIEMTFSVVIIACLLGLGTSQGNTLSFLASPGFVRVVGYEGAHSLNIDIKVQSDQTL